MRYNDEILGLAKSPKYKYAQAVLHSLLKREIPDEKVLRKLYKRSYKKILQFSERFVAEDYGPARTHDTSAPQTISEARLKVANDRTFQYIHHELLDFKVPDTKHLRKFYGKHADAVSLSFGLFIEGKKLRKSGISMTCHHNRVACTFHELDKNNVEVELYTSIAALHDFIEDLMYNLMDMSGNRYTIASYQQFLDRLIPADLQQPIKLLTNHYDMILKYVDYHLDRRGKRFNKPNVLEFLKQLDYQAYDQLKDYITKIINLIETSPDEERSSKDYLEEIKWKCYTGLYIPELVSISYKDMEHMLLMIKMVDLSDNNHGLDSMDQSSKIKNIRKSVITADLIMKLDNVSMLEPFAREIREDALVKAEHLVLRDLMHQESCQDFFVDALVKIHRMQDVLYANPIAKRLGTAFAVSK